MGIEGKLEYHVATGFRCDHDILRQVVVDQLARGNGVAPDIRVIADVDVVALGAAVVVRQALEVANQADCPVGALLLVSDHRGRSGDE